MEKEHEQREEEEASLWWCGAPLRRVGSPSGSSPRSVLIKICARKKIGKKRREETTDS